MGQGTLTALRHSNLAHLLAISGLHMGLLAGFVFGVLRLGLIGFALRYPVKKFAATGALAVAAGYLALSGGNVATERAFVMVAVALLAVLCDRRAISLRAVAISSLACLTGCAVTRVPLLRLRSITPRSASSRRALLTVARAQPNSVASSASVGNSAP